MISPWYSFSLDIFPITEVQDLLDYKLFPISDLLSANRENRDYKRNALRYTIFCDIEHYNSDEFSKLSFNPLIVSKFSCSKYSHTLLVRPSKNSFSSLYDDLKRSKSFARK